MGTTTRRRAVAALTAVGAATTLVAVGASTGTAGAHGWPNDRTVVDYDSSTMAEYSAKWSNPYGLGEMAVSDTRTVTDGKFKISAVPFQTAYDFSVYDHLKYLAVSNQAFPVPERGTVTFGVDIKAETPGAEPGHVIKGQYGPPGSYDPSQPNTYRRRLLEGQQAGVVLNMIDFCTGQLFDWFVSGSRAFPLIERLPTSVTGNTANPNCPGATEVGLDKAYTQIIKDIPLRPGRTHRVDISYTRTRFGNNVTYFLDGLPVASVNNVGVPLDKQRGERYTGIYPSFGPGEDLTDEINSFSMGHGLFSLLDAFPFQYGCSPPSASGPGVCSPETAASSVSIPVSERAFGQGARGSFSNFRITTVER